MGANIFNFPNGGGEFVECCVIGTEHDRGDGITIFDGHLKHVFSAGLGAQDPNCECFIYSKPGNGKMACSAKVNGHFVGCDKYTGKYLDKDCTIGESLLTGANYDLFCVIFCTKVFD